MNIKRLKEKTQTLTLLFVEDNEELAKVKYEMYKDIFKTVVQAKDGYEGLAKYQEEHFDLVITDINMPNMDGLQMVEKIQKINANQAVIVVSAYTEYEYMNKLKKLNIDSFLMKPVETKRLMIEIDKSIKNSEAA